MSGFTPSYDPSNGLRPSSPVFAGRTHREGMTSPGGGTPPVGGDPGRNPLERSGEPEPVFPPCWWCGRTEIGMVLGDGNEPNRHFCRDHDGAWRADTEDKDLLPQAEERESETNMPKYGVTETTFELPDPGWYDAVLTEINEKTITNTETGETSETLEWSFDVVGVDNPIRVLSSQNFSKRSKGYAWASALIEVDDEVDTDDLEGLACRVKVFHKPSKRDPSQAFPSIDEVRSPKVEPVRATTKAKLKAAPTPVPVGAPAEDEAPF